MITTTPQPKATLSVNEVAERLGIGRDAVYQLLNAGRLKSIKIGRRRIIPIKALEAFLDKETQEET